MKKTTINGMQYVAVREVREELRYLRKNIDTLYCNFDKEKRAMVHLAYNDVVRALYREELEAAKTPEEHKAIIEMPGDFMVIHKIGNKQYEAFVEWRDKQAVIGKLDEGMVFSYEGMAEHVAEMLGDGWEVFDASPEAHARVKRLMDAIFREDEDDGED